MATPPSSYGERPPLQGFRRSFTLPARSLSVHEKAGLSKSDASADVLYSHPAARIVSFSPPPESIRSNTNVVPPDTDYPVDTVETLPWRSRTESLAASGLMVIEKVRGSTNFLKSGDVMHALMRNSQCWCVDGESKFVLRVRKFQYYRIELPSGTEGDEKKVEELKTCLQKILRFERTPCPFVRAFHVDLPDDAIAPRRKGPWRRPESSLSSTPETDTPPLRRKKNIRAFSAQVPSSIYPPHAPNGEQRGLPSTHRFDTRSPSRPNSNGSDAIRSVTPSSIASSVEEGNARGQVEAIDPGDLESQKAAYIHEEAAHGITESINAAVTLQQQDSDRGQQLTEQEINSVRSELQADPVSEPRAVDTPSARQVRKEEPFEQAEPKTRALEENMVDFKAADEAVGPGSPGVFSNEGEMKEAHTKETFAYSEDVVPASIQQTGLDPQDDLYENGSFSTMKVDLRTTDKQSAAPIPNGTKQQAVQNDASEDMNSEPQRPEELPAVTEPSIDMDDAHEEPLSRVSSADSFHTMASADANSPTTRQFIPSVLERISSPVMRATQHKRELSEMTVTASSVGSSFEAEDFSAGPGSFPISEHTTTPALTRSSASDISWSDIGTPSSPIIRDGLRHRSKHRRSLSPLPASSVVFSPPKQNHGNHLTSAILQKAATVAVVKPVEVVVLLVHILVRIAGGATVNDLLSGSLFKKPEQHRRSSSFPDGVDTRVNDEDDEDDFVVPVGDRERSADLGTARRDADIDSLFELD